MLRPPGRCERLRAAQTEGPAREESWCIQEARSTREIEEAELSKLFFQCREIVQTCNIHRPTPGTQYLMSVSQNLAQSMDSVQWYRRSCLPANSQSSKAKKELRAHLRASLALVRTPRREGKPLLALHLLLPVHPPQQNEMWKVCQFLMTLRDGTVAAPVTQNRQQNLSEAPSSLHSG